MRRLVGLPLLFVAATALAQPAPPKGNWIADSKSGCRVQNPEPEPGESVRWNGACQNGLAQGRGTLEWFKNGQPNGKTEGEWRAGILNGRALTTWPDGRRYEGEVRNGELNGRGIMTFPNGTRIDATFRNGKANGRGIATFPDGSKLDADFVDNQPVHGTWVFANGNRYEGDLKNLMKHGKGKWSQKENGATYEGEFVDNRQEGYGVAMLPNGDRYEGEWKNNRPNGRGKSYGGGISNSGTWVDGCLSQANSDFGRWSTFNNSPQACGFR